jgi:hypothetical protein
MTYTPAEISAYLQSFGRRMAAYEDAAFTEFYLWVEAVKKVQPEIFTK